MKLIIPALIATSMALSLTAQTTGPFFGKVLDSKGKPVPNVKLTISKVGLTWIKEIKVGEDGKFFQVGLDPKDYDITVSAPGYPEIKDKGHIAIGTGLQKDYALLTTEEAIKAGKIVGATDPGALADAKGSDAYNQAVIAFNEKNFVAAMPLFEAALSNFTESVGITKDEAAKALTKKNMESIERPYAFSLMEVAKTDESRRAACLAKAEPLLAKVFERNAKDKFTIIYLLDLAKAKNDAEGVKKYQAILDAVAGPRPELAYNQGVELYNATKLAEAKPYFQKAIAIKADYADAYYLLAMCEFAEMNLKGTRINLQKYLELDPSGKYAADVKEMLKAPELKNAK